MTKSNEPTTATKAAYTGDIPSGPIGFLWYTTKPFWPLLALGVAFNVATQLLNTYTAVFIGNFADASVTILSANEFAHWSIVFVLLLGSVFFSFRISGFISISLVLKQSARAFETIKAHLLLHSHNYFTNRFAGSLTSKVFHVGDRGSELLLMTYYGFIRLTIGLTATGVVIAFFSLPLAGIYSVILLVTILVNVYLVQRRRPLVVDYASASSGYRGRITDVLSNIQAARQYAKIKYEYEKSNETLADRITKDGRQWRAAEWNHVANNVLALILMASMVGGIYWLLIKDLASIGAMVTVMILMYRVSGIIVDLGEWMNRFIRIYGEVEEGLEDVLIDHEVEDVPNATTLDVQRGEIVLEECRFHLRSE